MRYGLIDAAALLLLLIPAAACGQTADPSIPTLPSGQMPVPVPRDEAQGTNVFSGRIAVGARFDDNAVLSSAGRRSDIGYAFTPSLAFVQMRPRLNWTVSYGPGADISQHGLYPDQLTHYFGGQFTWLPSKHSIFSAQQNYILSTNPFQQFGEQPFTTTPGPLVSPNQSIFLPSLRRTSFLSQAQYSYELSEHTMVGMGGSYGREDFNHNPGSGLTAPSFISSRVASGQAFLAHQFTRRSELGVQYGVQLLRFPQGNSRTAAHALQLFDEVKLTPNTSFTLYGGPQYSLTANQVQLNFLFFIVTIPVKENTWSWSAGGIYSWTGRREALVLNYKHGISNGGALFGAVTLDSGSADLTWKLTSHWNLRADIAGANNHLLGVQNRQSELRTYSARMGLSRQISQDLSMDFFYERINQTGILPGLPTGNHDLVGVSFAYTFKKPIGR